MHTCAIERPRSFFSRRMPGKTTTTAMSIVAKAKAYVKFSSSDASREPPSTIRSDAAEEVTPPNSLDVSQRYSPACRSCTLPIRSVLPVSLSCFSRDSLAAQKSH